MAGNGHGRWVCAGGRLLLTGGTVEEIVASPKIYIHLLTLGTCDVALFGNRIFADVTKLKCGHI